MPVHHRKIKLITFGVDVNQFECQISSWNVNNNTPDGDRHFTLCPDGEFREETDPDYSLDLTFFADWRLDGISDYFTTHDGEELPFTLVHHPDVIEERVTWTGTVTIKAPNAGGEARATESQSLTLPIIGKPDYTRG